MAEYKPSEIYASCMYLYDENFVIPILKVLNKWKC